MMENLYCRFCAEPKSVEGLLNLDCDENKCNEVLFKLSFLNAMYVNVSQDNNLPKTVCHLCYDSLNKAYDFLDRVKRAQDILSTLFETNDKFDISDYEKAALDEFFAESNDASETKEKSEIKQNLDISSYKINVKIEPKEDEAFPSDIFQAAVNKIHSEASQSNQSINVQDFLESTIIKEKSPPEVEVSTREIPAIAKRSSKSWKEYVWVCAFCNIGFLDAETLRTHSKAVHSKCAAFSCIDCKIYTKTDDFIGFIRHVKKHRFNLRNNCHYCDEVLDAESLKAHLKQHLVKSHACSSCGEIFQNTELFQQHLNTYIAIKPKRKPRRKAGTPITVEDLTCHICNKVYKNPNSLRDHIKRHRTDRKRNYTCDRCGKTFFSKGTLTSHVMAHDQYRPHVCKICNKSFQFPNMLRRHVEVHTGVKPYSCEVCGRSFRLQYQLNSHKIVHTDSMPYVCKFCHKAFRFKQILKSHERQHTGSKPYSCLQCFMDFSNWSNYNKHMRRRHNIETAKKKITPSGVFPVNPETGQIVQVQIEGMEEWKSKIMIPGKRGKKKVIKEEKVT